MTNLKLTEKYFTHRQRKKLANSQPDRQPIDDKVSAIHPVARIYCKTS